MRIVGGKFKAHTLTALGNTAHVRPTSDKVRGAILNMLEARGCVQDAYVLDAFCGTGALGLEALSRGAAHCIFWDKSPFSLRMCKTNISNFNLEAQSKVELVKSQNCPAKQPESNIFDLVFLDPPYDRGLVLPTIQALQNGGWVNGDTVFVIELSKTEQPDLAALDILQDKLYGDTRVLIAQALETS